MIEFLTEECGGGPTKEIDRLDDRDDHAGHRLLGLGKSWKALPCATASS
jgi:hypothetical protein